MSGSGAFLLGIPLWLAASTSVRGATFLPEAGVARTVITPDLARGPVCLAGYQQGRRATGVHDDLEARALLLRGKSGGVALVAVDLIGLFYDDVLAIRRALAAVPGADELSLIVAATHTHSGPDTLGLWGMNSESRGADDAYLARVRQAVVKTVMDAMMNLRPARLRVAQVEAGDLVTRNRLPRVTDGTLTALRIEETPDGSPIASVIFWGAHPEILTPDNTLISADFPGALRSAIEAVGGGLAIYFSGAVGAQSPHCDPIWNLHPNHLTSEGGFRKVELLGAELARRARHALQAAPNIPTEPIEVRTRKLAVPLTNPRFLQLREMGVIRRSISFHGMRQNPHVRTEANLIRVGEVALIAVPGEIYPEIVRGGIQSPQEPAADFPGAVREEPPLFELVPGRVKAVMGLANDELGYIIPKSQWDERPPFAYGLPSAQYGEVYSASYELGPLLHEAFRAMPRAPGLSKAS
jgi:neutral/alkaline ceramidase-like enzyme